LWKNWLQLGRAQTWPATFLLIMTPFLQGQFTFIGMLALVLFTWFVHFASFGHNSLMDAAMMYDQKDPSKKDHPLISGKISLTAAHNVIHWSLCGLSIWAIILSVALSPNPLPSIISIFIWFVFGYAYNSGLSKESLIGFLPISICFTAMAGWGWFLSHWDLNPGGIIYLAYAFLTILYQTSWSGFIKEMQLRERSNILVRMGAKLDETFWGKKLLPGKSRFYAYLVKGSGLVLACLLCWLNFSLVRLVVLVLLGTVVIWLLYQTTRNRVYDRNRELKLMSLMEVATIFLPIPLMLGLLESAVLMVGGVAYFWVMNKILWGTPLFPKV